jgi:hypothetical protein
MRPRIEPPSLEEQIALVEGSEDRRERLAEEISSDLAFQARLTVRRPTLRDRLSLFRPKRKV